MRRPHLSDSSHNDRSQPDAPIEHLADYLFPLPTPEMRADAERFRVEWERINGPSDLTRNYTSMWPSKVRTMLWKQDPEAYFRGLPPFAQEFILQRIKSEAKAGALDDVDPTYLRYMQKEN